jgi:tetratricopeptide (TPR) repeat protein
MEARQSKASVMLYGMAQQLRPLDPAVQAAVGRANLYFANYEAAVSALGVAQSFKKDDFDICLDLGRAEFEAGLLTYAVKSLEEAIRMKPDNPWPHHYLSLVHERRGHFPAAMESHRQAAARARNAIDFRPRGADDAAELAHLAKLTEQMAAVLRGDRKLDPIDRLPFARICAAQEKFVAAIQFYSEALAADPKLVDNYRAAYRIAAAAAAMMAGLGKGSEGKELSSEQRITYRQRARELLATEVTSLEKQMATADQAKFFAIQEVMRGWGGESLFGDIQFDPGVFLPGEREQWQRLWEKVDELAQRAYTKR